MFEYVVVGDTKVGDGGGIVRDDNWRCDTNVSKKSKIYLGISRSTGG